MTAFDPNIFTPYSTLLPLITDEFVGWAPQMEQERLASYQKYDELYWSYPKAFKLEMRGDAANPIYVPNPRQICDSTAHFLMKGLTVSVDGSEDLVAQLNSFLIREEFYGQFHTNKLAGVTRGDYCFHLRADPNKAAGGRLSLVTVDPASYFPLIDPDDPDHMLGGMLVDQVIDEDGQVRIKIQQYRIIDTTEGRRIETSSYLMKVEYWWDGQRGTKIKTITQPRLLPVGISTVPIFHFKNIDWQGQDFGSSELRGYERLMASVNQSVTDEELALALDGLGVYATDAGPPVDEDGEEEDWEIGPGSVMEIGQGERFDRVSGVGSIKPSQDHIAYLTNSLYEASGTFRPGMIDVQLAQSGIALAIKFLPSLAKTEQRETVGLDKLRQMFFNWKIWMKIYEGVNFGDREIIVELGDKLPLDPVRRVNELNNMLDRNVISRKYYREEMAKMGYIFPDSMEDEIIAELKKLQPVMSAPVAPKVNADGSVQGQNNSNNAGKPNESGGTEARPPAK